MKGILMTPDNSQKCHDGTKTQTRRLIKPQPTYYSHYVLAWKGKQYWIKATYPDDTLASASPYRIGEHVYIKEAHYRYGHWEDTGKLTKHGRVEYRFIPESDNVLYLENPPDSYLTSPTGYFNGTAWYKRSSLFLPANLARTIVEITDIRAQRVQDISWSDAVAEGIVYEYGQTVVPQFQALWDSIHGEDAWDRNEYCWAYSIALVSTER